MRGGAELHTLGHLGVDDGVHSVSEHEHNDVAVEPELAARAGAVAALHVEGSRGGGSALGSDHLLGVRWYALVIVCRLGFMDYGLWFMVYGLWFMV